jgi:D-aminopeptidase
MSCFGLKGGIGSASRRLRLDGETYHLGVLVLANFGRAGDLRLPDGRRVSPGSAPTAAEAGSCIVVIGSDVPLDHRQLTRVARRAGVGLAWCGSFWGTGSGDIALAFTTANRRASDDADQDLIEQRVLAEGRIDRLFQAAAEGTHEAVLDALAAAKTMVGRNGHRRLALAEVLQPPL